MVKRLKDANAPKKASSAYFLWLAVERPVIMKAHPEFVGQPATVVMKEAGVRWGKMTDAKKAPFIKKSTKAKAKYTAAMEKYKKSASYAAFQEQKAKHDKKQKIKSVQEPEGKPKRSPNAFQLFMADNRAKITKKKPASEKITWIMAEGGRRWKAFPENKRKKYTDKAAELREEHVEEMRIYKETQEYKDYLEELATVKRSIKDAEKAEKKREKKRKAAEDSNPRPAKKSKKNKKGGRAN